MPISVKNDIKKEYGFGSSYSLRKIPGLENGGSVLNAVRADIALQKWKEFYWSWYGPLDMKRDMIRSLASKFNYNPATDKDAFNELWHFIREADAYKKSVKADVHADIETAYGHIANIANGGTVNRKTFSRLASSSDSSFVIFSDFHMTAFSNKPNYFHEFNYSLYLKVLNVYAAANVCLVENGDVEECIIFEPDFEDAKARMQQAPNGVGINEIKYPVTLDDKWQEFMTTRYAKRAENLVNIIEKFAGYYDIIRNKFIARNKYVRLAGNHDTYLDEEHERTLKNLIEDKLRVDDAHKAPVNDVLKITKNGQIKYLVFHGHQVDTVCVQHGNVPYAKSLGEVFSECLSWAYQGPDRVWEEKDTRRWYYGYSPDSTVTTKGNYCNMLAREEHGDYKYDAMGNLVLNENKQIREDSKHFVESILGHEIAWEYFENTGNATDVGFNAFTLEVWTGDEMYKMRHMNEIDLCTRYASKFLNLAGASARVPKLVLGHTHEPRQNAVNPLNESSAPYWYLNSGSAGRYENLIWCVEIFTNASGEFEDRICSWSEVDGQLKKITWKSAGKQLVHDRVELYPA